MAKTAAERQKEYEQRRKEGGWKRIYVWIAPGVDQEKVRKYIDRQNKAAS